MFVCFFWGGFSLGDFGVDGRLFLGDLEMFEVVFRSSEGFLRHFKCFFRFNASFERPKGLDGWWTGGGLFVCFFGGGFSLGDFEVDGRLFLGDLEMFEVVFPSSEGFLRHFKCFFRFNASFERPKGLDGWWTGGGLFVCFFWGGFSLGDFGVDGGLFLGDLEMFEVVFPSSEGFLRHFKCFFRFNASFERPKGGWMVEDWWFGV